MNTKHYVSLYMAEKLREKGYNEDTETIYNIIGELERVESMFRRRCAANTMLSEYGYISAPTLLEAMDWLEEKGIIVIVGWDSQTKKWFFLINRKEHLHVTYNSTIDSDEDDYTDRNECMQKAIEKALTVL